MADTRFAPAAPGGTEQVAAPPPAGDMPFDRQGMWIWYVDRSDGGDVWSQSNKTLVGALHQGGLDVEATYGGASRKDIIRFRRLDEIFGGLTPSRWDWQALGAPLVGPVLGHRPIVSHPVLRRDSEGDLVVWAQERLQTAIQPELPITGIFGKQTWAAVRASQQSQGLPVDGVLGTTTWGSLLNFDPARPRWAGRRAKRGGGATASRAFPPRRPFSALLPAKAHEIDPGPAP